MTANNPTPAPTSEDIAWLEREIAEYDGTGCCDEPKCVDCAHAERLTRILAALRAASTPKEQEKQNKRIIAVYEERDPYLIKSERPNAPTMTDKLVANNEALFNENVALRAELERVTADRDDWILLELKSRRNAEGLVEELRSVTAERDALKLDTTMTPKE